MAAWTKKEVELLITLFEGKRELWDVKDPLYQNRVRKESALYGIVDGLQASVPHSELRTVKDVRNKIQSLRGQYRKELRQLENSKRSGAGAEEVKKPSLWFFDQMDFLKPHVEIRQGRSNLENSPPQNVTHNDAEMNAERPIILNESSSSTSNKSRKRKATEALKQDVQDLANIVSTNSRPRRYEWFGEQMVEALNDFSNEEIVDETIEVVQRVLREQKKKDRNMSHRPSTSSDLLREALHGVIDDDDIL